MPLGARFSLPESLDSPDSPQVNERALTFGEGGRGGGGEELLEKASWATQLGEPLVASSMLSTALGSMTLMSARARKRESQLLLGDHSSASHTASMLQALDATSEAEVHRLEGWSGAPTSNARRL